MVLFFNCPEHVAMERFITRKLAGREKDDGEMFTKRYREFKDLNPDIVEHYRKRGILVEVCIACQLNGSMNQILILK